MCMWADFWEFLTSPHCNVYVPVEILGQFPKVFYIAIWQSKYGSGLTFETGFYQTSPHCSNCENSQKSAHYKLYYVKWVFNWLLRITRCQFSAGNVCACWPRSWRHYGICVLQCVAVCCSVLQYVAVYYSVLQSVERHYGILFDLYTYMNLWVYVHCVWVCFCWPRSRTR